MISRVDAAKRRLERAERLLIFVVCDPEIIPRPPGLSEAQVAVIEAVWQRQEDMILAVGKWVHFCRDELQRAEKDLPPLATLAPSDEVAQ